MKPEQKFHEHHERLIGRFRNHYESAHRAPESAMDELVGYLRDELLPHARAEEDVLYAAVDELAGTELATAAMRSDHRTLEERIEELARTAGEDPKEIRRQLVEFSTVLLNHFHKEEEILVPFLEERLDDEDFEDLLSDVHQAEKERH